MLITDVRYFKPEIVSAIFRANRIIEDSESVAKLTQVSMNRTTHNQEYRFAVQYTDFRTQRHAPDHLQLILISKGTTFVRREVEFFNRVLVVMKRRLDGESLRFPLCYDAYYDEISEQAHLILEDVSQEFKPSKDKAPPAARHREQVIDTLAILHAYWWDHPQLEELATLPTEASLASMIEQYQAKLAKIKKSVGTYLKPKHINILEKIASGIPSQRHKRLVNNQGLTIIHNNLSPENIVYSLLETCIINWHDWTVGIGVDDLAMLIPFNFPPELRQYQEKQLLKRYYDTLLQGGVSNYTWETFEYDYKASLAAIIGRLLSQWTFDEHTRGHWRKMEVAIDRFIDMQGGVIFDSQSL